MGGAQVFDMGAIIFSIRGRGKWGGGGLWYDILIESSVCNGSVKAFIHGSFTKSDQCVKN